MAGLRLRRIGPVGGRRAPVSHTNDGKWQILTDGGIEPVWAHSGRELFYKSGDLMSVEVLPGDQRFVMIRSFGAEEAGELIVVENFFEELKAKSGLWLCDISLQLLRCRVPRSTLASCRWPMLAPSPQQTPRRTPLRRRDRCHPRGSAASLTTPGKRIVATAHRRSFSL